MPEVPEMIAIAGAGELEAGRYRIPVNVSPGVFEGNATRVGANGASAAPAANRAANSCARSTPAKRTTVLHRVFETRPLRARKR
jgi:hypothetical protein